ncbi:MAG: preprotein translocase subunit SecA [Chloroflexota bacterium]
MLNFISKLLGGNKSEKDVKLIRPIVDEINRYYAELDKLTDEELRAKTEEFKARIREAVQELEDEKGELLNRLKNETLSAAETIDVTDRLKAVEKEIYQTSNDMLDEILPEAYACVKQACRRLKDSGYHYEYAGQLSKWDMVPYDVQLIGGIVQHQGKISEMATGEGKTLVAVLPLYLNALAGKGVHLVTVNDYLAKRDCDWMRPVYEFLGLEVGAIQSNMENDERKRIYNMDITYGTNNEFGFDYLRDNMVVEYDHMVQREHWFAIVDEVDSVLIDEARTPLIISGPVEQSDQKFEEMNPRVQRLVDAQTKLVNQIASEAAALLEKNTKEDREQAGIQLFRATRGLPKHKRLIKLMQDAENIKLKNETELFFLRDQGRRMPEIDDELYYTVDEKNHQIDITEKGRLLLCNSTEDPDMFVIPDIAAELSALEGDNDLTPEEKQLQKDKIHLLYAERSDRIHTISQLLRAYSLYEKDVEYVIQEGKIMIVDEFTGRILEGRRYSEGLHQAIEAKERVKVERDTQTFATITLQNYFRLYHKLAGMTGTAETEAGEFEKIYNLEVVVIPTNRPIVRKDDDDLIYRTKREKYNAIVDEVKKLNNAGRAVLVGTASVEVSEIISKMLQRQGVRHNVLNAKNHAREAEIVANAGKKSAVTIATNMAGRGTDIKLDADVKASGGLAIIGSERHEARRIDRQLRGRAGRQGDPGSSQFFISLEDNLMRLFGGDRTAWAMQRLKVEEGEPIQHSILTKAVERAQKKVEENHFSTRKRLLEYDNVMNQQRVVIYNRRRSALRGERLRGELFEYIEEIAENWFEDSHDDGNFEAFVNNCRTTLLTEPKLTNEEFRTIKVDEAVQRIVEAANEFYTRKEEMLGHEFMQKLEQVAVLQTIDDKWRDHLRAMDELKEGIYLRSYGQKDPLLEYKSEAFKMFVELIGEINRDSVAFAFKYFPRMVERQVRVAAPSPQLRRRQPGVSAEQDGEVEAQPVGAEDAPTLKRSRTAQRSSLVYKHEDTNPSFISGYEAPQAQESEAPMASTIHTFKRGEDKVGRNDLCPCGSGKKYKKCHGAKGEAGE